MRVVSFLFHQAEVFNREVTSIAAYRLARSSGAGHDNALDSARDLTYEAHFDYGNVNRARFMQGDVAKVALMFRQYSLNMTYMLTRNAYLSLQGESQAARNDARKKLAGILGMHALAAGAMGMPLFSTTMAVLNAVLDTDDDDPWDAEVGFRQFLADYFGKDAGAAIAHEPVQAITGVGISERVALNELWFRSPYQDLEGEALVGYWLEQLAGPVGGIAINAGRGYDLIREGHLYRGIETMLPKVIKDGLRGLRYSQEGVNTLSGDPLLSEPTAGEIWQQVFGFMPARLAARYDENSARSELERRLLTRRQRLLNRVAMGVMSGDTAGRDEAMEAVRGFNAKHPNIAIELDTLRRSMLYRQRRAAESMEGASFDRRLRSQLREIEFAD